jgi:Tfp pilus assembly ATPase PilU
MPTYIFRNTETDEISEVWMKMSEREPYLEANPHLVQMFSVPAVSYNDAKKPDDSFRDILRDIKKGSGKGANINTF